jgi:hypothetical protein
VTRRYLSVNFFGNVESSLRPFPWTITFDPNGEIRIRSDQHNLFLQANAPAEPNNLVLRAQNNQAGQAWRFVNAPNGEGLVIQNSQFPNVSLGGQIDMIK